MKFDKQVLRRQFKYWTLHCILTALPSFCFALLAFNSPLAITGMLSGVATFILAYSLLSSWPAYDELATRTMVGRAVKLGARIRVGVSVWSAVCFSSFLAVPGLLNFNPDFWAGMASVYGLEWLYDILGMNGDFDGGSDQFLPTYLITVTEGLLLSVCLVGFSVVALAILNRRHSHPSS